MRKLRPEQRVSIGRNAILTMGALYCLSRSIYYSTVNPESLSGAQEVITADGNALGVWSAIWALAALFCIVDMVNRHTRHGLSMLAGIALGWGFAYFVIWCATGCSDFTLIQSSVGWLAPAVFIFGFLLKVTALQDMLRSRPQEAP